MDSPLRAPTPLSEPEMGTRGSMMQPSGSESGDEDGVIRKETMPRRDRRRMTEPSPTFLEFLRKLPAPSDCTSCSGEEDAEHVGDRGSASDKDEPLVSVMPSLRQSRAPSSRMRHRLSGAPRLADNFPLSVTKRLSSKGLSTSKVYESRKRRSNQKLRFKLDLSPLEAHLVSKAKATSLRQRLIAGLVAVLRVGLAGIFGLSTAWFLFGGFLWVVRGRKPRFRDNFAIDLDADNRWSLHELALSASINSFVGLLALALAKVALAVYYYAWLGLQAIRKNRRVAELQKTSPFFINRVSLVDRSMLEYLQSNYDFGPVTTLVPTSPVAHAAIDDSSESSRSPEMRPRNHSLPARREPRKPSFCASSDPSASTERRNLRRRNTSKSASEYVSLHTANQELDGEGEQGASECRSGSKEMQSSISADSTTMTGQPSFLDDAKLQELVCKLSDWNFDIFEVAELTPKVLSFIGFVCLDAYSKLVDFEKPKLMEFLRAVENSYRKVPYHNSLHGASVARSVYSFCAGCGLSFTEEYMEFTIVLAGLVHDVHHPGLTPAFLSKASVTGEWSSPITPPLEHDDTELSLKYNDQSPLENMHCAITFELLRNEKTAFLAREEVAAMRKPLLRAILGTDMAKHAETMTRLTALIDNLKHDHESGLVPWHWPAKPPATADDGQREVWERLCQEEFVMELFLHAADIGNPTLPFEQWVRWNRVVQQEFHLQGDRELLEFHEFISPPAGFDRNSLPKAEHGFTKGFMQYLSLPLFQQLHDLTQVESRKSVCQGVNIVVCLDNLKRNLELWEGYTPVRDVEQKESEFLVPAPS